MAATNQVHFVRTGRFICLQATVGDAKTTECARVNCLDCLRSLVREAVPGTKLATKLTAQYATVKRSAK